MREILPVALIWFHLTATVIWLGGIAFILLVALPSARQALRGEAGGLMGEITRLPRVARKAQDWFFMVLADFIPPRFSVFSTSPNGTVNC
jgi:uncharacterized membrane protein